MGAYKDLTGARIGRLTVIQNTYQKSKNGSFIWKCLCDCGNEVSLPTSSLTRQRNTNSCGCYNTDMSKQKNTKNIIGNKYGMLTVIAYANKPIYRTKLKGSWWYCNCDCGRKNILIKGKNLISGNTKSCGCMSMSSTEKQITQILNNHNIKYIKEYSFSDCCSPITGRLLKFDFAIFNNNQSLLYLLEYDGEQHTYGTRYEKNVLKRQTINSRYQQNDKEKDKYCKQNNLKLYRISYKQKDALEDIILKAYEEEKEECNSSQEKLKKDN